MENRLIEGWDGRDYERHPSHRRAWGSDLIQWYFPSVMLTLTLQADGTYREPFHRMNVRARKAG